ncbi:MAG: exonuclease SbcCD subunit D [Bacteroidia bacterium]|nr:exonuclease SbcCD subunit D [Bacteroidia bacterium]
MKILHTADWHLGKRLEQFSRLEEQREVLNEICEIADRESVDVVLIAGDLFDHPNPPIEALDLFYQTLKRLTNGGKRPVIGIAGNHDSPDRIQAPDPLARECGILLMGYPRGEIRPFKLESGLEITRSAPGFVELVIPGQNHPLRLLLTPYANELRLREYLGAEDREVELRSLLAAHWKEVADAYCDDAGVNVLMTHLFVTNQQADMPEEDEEERSVLTLGGAQEIFVKDFPKGLSYAALGHIHSHYVLQQSPYPVAYSSSPLVYSISDRQKEKAVLIATCEPGQPAEVSAVLLSSGKQALSKRFESIDEAVSWLGEHPNTLVELHIATDTHLTAEDRKRLAGAHAGILRVVPEFTNPELLKFTSGKQIDLSRSTEELFKDYFLHKKGQQPNEELLALFQEVLSEEQD